MYCLFIVFTFVACGTHQESDIGSVPFGRLDASASLSVNANTLSEDYDAGGIAMYKALAASTTSNMIFSAYAVQTAMGMMYAGAGGNTATNMAQTMSWRLSPTDLPVAHAQLASVIATNANNEGVALQTGTRLWVDATLGLKADYAAGLAQNYQANAVVQPLLSDAEGSRQTINAWVSDQTHALIPSLIPAQALEGAILVQTAAIYFKAPWVATFDRDSAANTPFTHTDGSQSMVTMVRASDIFSYANTDDYQAIDINYGRGSMALLVVIPKGTWTAFEQSLEGAFVHRVLAGLGGSRVDVSLPVLDLQQTPDMTAALKSMGLSDAFNADADFSAIGALPVNMSQILEQATLKLDENGTEAAAAAAVIGEITAANIDPDIVTFTADHPFFFAVHDTISGTPLFTGRVLAP